MLERISELMRDKLGVPDEMAITGDISFKDDLLSDSFEMMEWNNKVNNQIKTIDRKAENKHKDNNIQNT